MNEMFSFCGKIYKTVTFNGTEKHCENCVFRKNMECEMSSDIPYCDKAYREDGKDVYFVEAKTNFDKLTENSEILANNIVYFKNDENYKGHWYGLTGYGVHESFDSKNDALKATIDFLNSETK